MASHSSLRRQEPCATPPNWLDLPVDVCTSIIKRLRVVEILTNAQHVCSTWRRICRDPYMWRSIDIRYHSVLFLQAVDLSSGGLLDMNIEYACDGILRYASNRSKHLRRLRLFRCAISDVELVDAAGKIPLLQELDLSYCMFSVEVVAEVGRLCPLLKSFKLNAPECDYYASDDEAFAIAKNMYGLHHLQIFNNPLSNVGLIAILDGCQQLESLDLRQCIHVNLDADLKRRFSEHVKHFRGPHDSTDDIPLYSEVEDEVSDDDDSYMSSDEEFVSDGETGDEFDRYLYYGSE